MREPLAARMEKVRLMVDNSNQGFGGGDNPNSGAAQPEWPQQPGQPGYGPPQTGTLGYGQPQPGYAPPGYPQAGYGYQASPRPRPNFSDIPIRDYLLDAATALVLFIAMFLRWNLEVGVSGAESSTLFTVIVVLILFLSVASVTLPYLARLGMLGAPKTPAQVGRLRLMANVPLAALIVAFVLWDIAAGLVQLGDTPAYIGEGAGLWFGAAGFVLAAMPRAAEAAAGTVRNRWQSLVKAAMFVALGLTIAAALLAILAVLDNDDPGLAAKLAVSKLFTGIYAVAPVVLVVVGLMRKYLVWRIALMLAGISILAAGFFLGFSEISVVEAFGVSTYWAFVAWAAAGIAAIAAGGDNTSGAHDGYMWLEGARLAMLLVAVQAFGWAVVIVINAVVTTSIYGDFIENGSDMGTAVLLGFFSALTGAAAFVGTRILRPKYAANADPRPSREAFFGIVLAVLVLTTARSLAASIMSETEESVLNTMDLVIPFLALAAAVTLVAAKPVRDLYQGVPLFGAVNTPSPQGQFPPHGQYPPQGHYAPQTQYIPQAYPSQMPPSTEGFGQAPTSCGFDQSQPSSGDFPAEAESSAPATQMMPSVGGMTPPPGSATESKPDPQPEPEPKPEPTVHPATTQLEVQPDFDAEAAADPATPLTELARLAGVRPDLRPAIARNPSTYPDLLNWLAGFGDPEITAALQQRN